ncbi:MAG: hypothetical protein JXR76_00635 [Deltaproteobacteria bacterium]|nr:hypothetical protein [Deltaproteobacteria bacterium]
MADHGFGSTILLDHLLGLHDIDLIIRFRQNYYFESEIYSGQALNAVAPNGRIRVFHHARLASNKIMQGRQNERGVVHCHKHHHLQLQGYC